MTRAQLLELENHLQHAAGALRAAWVLCKHNGMQPTAPMRRPYRFRPTIAPTTDRAAARIFAQVAHGFGAARMDVNRAGFRFCLLGRMRIMPAPPGCRPRGKSL